MTASAGRGVYESCRDTLDAMMHTGASVHALEHAIEAFPIDGEERSALWLWATASPHARRSSDP